MFGINDDDDDDDNDYDYKCNSFSLLNCTLLHFGVQTSHLATYSLPYFSSIHPSIHTHYGCIQLCSIHQQTSLPTATIIGSIYHLGSS